jgi:threonine dehydratase
MLTYQTHLDLPPHPFALSLLRSKQPFLSTHYQTIIPSSFVSLFKGKHILIYIKSNYMAQSKASEYKLVSLENIKQAKENLTGISIHTPLMPNLNLSEELNANILLKREDLQIVRSYKIRGAYHKMISLTPEEAKRGVVCASAGNHAQGMAYCCKILGIKGTIFMPSTTPSQKIKQVKMFGKECIEVILTGDTFDDSYNEAKTYYQKHNSIFIHPFDDIKVIEGQGTVGLEILEDVHEKIDYLFLPIGGGGLAAGVGSVFKQLSPDTKIIGVEPLGAPKMHTSIKNNQNTTLVEIDKFVDGAAVKRAGDLPFEICKNILDDIILVPEGKVCSTILRLYNEEAIVVEPAGSLTIAALDFYKEKIKGKNIVCIISGSNNDVTRMEEIMERSMLYEGLKHYFIIRFPQRAGALREFLQDILGPEDNIVHFEYHKKHNREKGPALVGLEVKNREAYHELVKRMEEKNLVYEYLNDRPDLFQYIL